MKNSVNKDENEMHLLLHPFTRERKKKNENAKERKRKRTQKKTKTQTTQKNQNAYFQERRRIF